MSLDFLLHFHTFWVTPNSVFIEAQFSNYYQVESVPSKKTKEKKILCEIKRF